MKNNIIKKKKIMKTKRKVKKNSDVIMVDCLHKLLTMLETTFKKRNKTRMVWEKEAIMVDV
jgi:adenosyl cobinamide kinase/adenosyl cobinamide phosphate guanylyltransferase